MNVLAEQLRRLYERASKGQPANYEVLLAAAQRLEEQERLVADYVEALLCPKNP